MVFDPKKSSIVVVKGALYNLRELEHLFNLERVAVDGDWYVDRDDSEKRRLTIYQNVQLPDGRTVFKQPHRPIGSYLVGTIIGKVDTNKLSYNDYLYIYDCLYNEGQFTVADVKRMKYRKERFYHIENDARMFQEEDDVIIISQTPLATPGHRSIEYIKLGIDAINYLKGEVQEYPNDHYVIAVGDCTCCS